MQSGAHIRLVLWKAEKAVGKKDRDSIAETGLNPSDFAILEVLLSKGPLAVNTIGEKVLLTSGSMTAAVNRLESRGLVSRSKDPQDGRCFHVHLSQSGRRLIEQAFQKHQRNLERLFAVLTPQERDDLVRLLKKIGYHAEAVQLG
jgi:MarR family 2-MHQ and catechol resistance regulon transcriptional repressor